MDYKNIVGQEQIKEFIKKSIMKNKVSHAYLINGENGTGKHNIASLFAASLQCASPVDEWEESEYNRPCGECVSCKQMADGNQPDVIVIKPEEDKKVIGVDVIREKLNATAAIKPYAGPYKIYIIPDADTMNIAAQNALLKTIEEPPEYVVIILLVQNIGAMLPTILSRCVELNMKPLTETVIIDYLMKYMHIPDYLAQSSAVFAQGNIGKAVRFATDSDFIEVRNEVIRLLKSIENKKVDELIDIINHIKEEKYNIDDYLDIMILWYRDVLLFKAVKDASTLIFKEETKYVMAEAKIRSYENLETCIEAIDKAKQRLYANVNFDMAMELLFMTLKEIS